MNILLLAAALTAPLGNVLNEDIVVTNVTITAEDIRAPVTNIVTKDYVEGLGITGGGGDVTKAYVDQQDAAIRNTLDGKADRTQAGYDGIIGTDVMYGMYLAYGVDYANYAAQAKQAENAAKATESDSAMYSTSAAILSDWSPTKTNPSWWFGYVAPEVLTYWQESGATLTNAWLRDVKAVERRVNTWESYWGGSNVVFEVTNYYGNTSGEIPSLRIKELIEDAATPYYKEVWCDKNKFDIFTSNIIAQVSASNAALVASTDAALRSYAAPRAWGRLTDIGSDNVISNTVWMTSPQTVFAGGTEYQRVAVGNGTICVLTTKGAQTWTAGEEGTFRFQDEGGEAYFGFSKTDSYTIGCNTDGIEVANGMVTLTYNLIMGSGEVPIIYYTPTLTPIAWEQLNNADGTSTGGSYEVTWGLGGTGVYYAHINCGNNPSGFFRAETTVAGEVVFETNMKAKFDGGVLCTDGITVIYPQPDGTWSTTK